MGITIAKTLEQPRRYVDSHIWVFCAEDEGEVCTEDDPKCNSCMLKIKQPQLCYGYPTMTQIRMNPIAAAKRFKECALSVEEAYDKMERVGIGQQNIGKALYKAYGP